MNTKILLIVFAFGILIGCSKDDYASKPQLKYKSVSTKVLGKNQSITFTLEVTDAEGDIQDTIWVQQVVRNCAQGGFKQPYRMPEFTGGKNLKGDINVCYSTGVGLDCPLISGPKCINRNDSCTFRFWIQDKARNMSDTISSEEVVVLQ